MKWKGIILLIFLSHSVLHSEELELSIADSLKMAMQHNLDLELQSINLEQLKWDNMWKWTAALPNLSGSGSLTRRNTDSTSLAIGVSQPQWGLSGSLDLSSPLGPMLALKILETISAHYNLKKGNLTYAKALKTIAIEVQKAYFNLLIAKEELEILNKQLTVILTQGEDLRRSYEAGLADEYTYLQFELQRLQVEQSINSQNSKLVNYQNALSVLLGRDTGTSYALSERIPELELEQLTTLFEAENVENNFDIRIGKIDDFMLRLGKTASILTLLPTVNVRWSSTRMFNADPMAEDWFNSSNWEDDSGSMVLTLALSISNFFPGSSAFSGVITSETNYKNNAVMIRKTRQTLKQQLANQQNALKLAINALDMTKTQKTLARKAFEIMTEKYNNGLAKYTEYQTAENDLLEVELDYLTQTVEILKTILDIYYILGEENDFNFN